jgi:hypothetical protein
MTGRILKAFCLSLLMAAAIHGQMITDFFCYPQCFSQEFIEGHMVWYRYVETLGWCAENDAYPYARMQVYPAWGYCEETVKVTLWGWASGGSPGRVYAETVVAPAWGGSIEADAWQDCLYQNGGSLEQEIRC